MSKNSEMSKGKFEVAHKGFSYIVLDETMAQEFVALFGKFVIDGEYLSECLKWHFKVNRYLCEAYEALSSENEELHAKINEIEANQDFWDIFYAHDVESNPKLNMDLFLNNNEVDRSEYENYKVALQSVLDHLDRNYIRVRRISEPMYKMQPTPLSFYEYKGYNDDSIPDPD